MLRSLRLITILSIITTSYVTWVFFQRIWGYMDILTLLLPILLVTLGVASYGTKEI